jgi:hypothetical protein
MQYAAPPRIPRIALLVVAWFNLVSAIAGMTGLTLGGGLGLPPEWLEGTVFSSYVGPGLILGFVVGGTQAVALLAQYRRHWLAWGLQATAGLTMMIWVFVEIAMLLFWSPLQGIFFTTGVLQTALAVLALGAWPHPSLARYENLPPQP